MCSELSSNRGSRDYTFNMVRLQKKIRSRQSRINENAIYLTQKNLAVMGFLKVVLKLVMTKLSS